LSAVHRRIYIWTSRWPHSALLTAMWQTISNYTVAHTKKHT